MKSLLILVALACASLSFAPPIPVDINDQLQTVKKLMDEVESMKTEAMKAEGEEYDELDAKIYKKLVEGMEKASELYASSQNEIEKIETEQDEDSVDYFKTIKLVHALTAADSAYDYLYLWVSIEDATEAQPKPASMDKYVETLGAQLSAHEEAFNHAVECFKLCP